ncbi:MAG: hypothetical protein SWK76_05215 [Actinomycetota bacterium]|nr:hypothetical protein [Actinomycetota bacterium]
MKKIILLLMLAVAVMALFTVPATARGEGTEVTVSQLLEDWEEYDGREVILCGEVVGDVMARGEYAWITVNDDTYSRQALHEEGTLDGQNSGIGVWLPTGEAEKIGRLGRYGSMGDFVEVRGIFRADDEQHGGDFDIQGQSLTILEKGRSVDTSPDGWEYFALGAALLFLLVSLTPILKRRALEMQRAKALLAREED